MRKPKMNLAARAALLAAAGLVMGGIPALAQVAEQEAILETHGGYRLVRGLAETVKGVADAIDGALAPASAADDIDAIVDLDPPARASSPYPEVGREDMTHLRRLWAMSPEARVQALNACVGGGGAREQCERQNLLPDEAFARQTMRRQEAAFVNQRREFEPAVQQRLRIAARDSVLLDRLNRDCADNANPGDACRGAVEDAERLGEENRALLAQPGVRAHFEERELSYALVSLSRAREVRMTPGAPAGEPFIAPMFVMDRLASACETYAPHVDRATGGPGAVRDRMRDELRGATLADLRQRVGDSRASPPARGAGAYEACLVRARMEQLDPTHRYGDEAPSVPSAPSGILRRETGSAAALQAQVGAGEAWAAGRDGRAAQHRAEMAASEARIRQINEQNRQDELRRQQQRAAEATRQAERRQDTRSGGEMVSTLLSVLGVAAQIHDANQRARSNNGVASSSQGREPLEYNCQRDGPRNPRGVCTGN